MLGDTKLDKKASNQNALERIYHLLFQLGFRMAKLTLGNGALLFFFLPSVLRLL
jgi:hypothetical protein